MKSSMNFTYFVRRTVIVFLMVEIIIFCVLYGFGPKSIRTLYDACAVEKNLLKQIGVLQQDIVILQEQIENSKTDFAKEKIAREVLLMKKDKEKIYFIES